MKTVIYARVSSAAQKPDLIRQREALERFCLARGYIIDEVIEEIGGGLNYTRPQFLRLMTMIENKEIGTLVIAFKDRLCRFGFEYFEHFLTIHEGKLIVANAQTLSPQQELVEDLFEITKQRKHDLLYALESNKPVTVQIFRREHKDNQWYIHLSTYVQAVPYISHKRNGCLGIDLNAKSLDLVYVKRDGNLHQVNGQKTLFSWDIPTGTTGQVEASLRDIVAEIVKIGESYECPIACEDLDFSKKKATLRHSAKKYNRMLSGFIYDKFRAFLVARAEKYGIEVIFKNPFATSVIGMVKYMAKYGLNSAYAAAMVIARRALGFSERIPRSYWAIIGICTESPEDGLVQSWGQWGKICKLLSKLKISRHQMFESAKVLEALQSVVSRTRRRKSPPRQERKVKSASKPVVFSNSKIHGESPMPQNC